MKFAKIRDTEAVIYEDGTVINSKGNIIKPWKESNIGYLLVRPERRGTCYRLHRLLAESFIPNPDNHKYVRHLNDVKDDNELLNLAWGTNSQNTQEGYDNSCYTFNKRSYQIKTVCHELGSVKIFKSVRSCAEELKLNRKSISAILNGKKRNTYKFDFEYFEMSND